MASILAKHGHGGNMSNVSNGPSTSPSSSSLPAQLHPAKIKPSQLLKTLELAKISSTTSSSSSSTTTTTTNTSSKPSFSNIKDISPEQLQAAKVQRKADMRLDPASIPEVTPDTTPALPEWATTAQREKYTSVGGAVYGSVQGNNDENGIGFN